MKGLNHPNIGEEGKECGLRGYQLGHLAEERVGGQKNWQFPQLDLFSLSSITAHWLCDLGPVT